MSKGADRVAEHHGLAGAVIRREARPSDGATIDEAGQDQLERHPRFGHRVHRRERRFVGQDVTAEDIGDLELDRDRGGVGQIDDAAVPIERVRGDAPGHRTPNAEVTLLGVAADAELPAARGQAHLLDQTVLDVVGLCHRPRPDRLREAA